jgi:hypothetical protein
VRSPFRSEAEAFRFLFVTVGAFAVIAAASLLGGAWVGVPAWAVLTAAAATYYVAQRRAAREIPTAPPHVGGEGERQILVVLDGTAADESAVGAIEEAWDGYRKRILVVCPARASHLDRWTSAVDGAVAQAQHYVDRSLDVLREAGIEAQGEIGDGDPLRAIEDSLRAFGADSILVVTLPERRDGPAAHDVVARARARFALPVTRAVVNVGVGATTR